MKILLIGMAIVACLVLLWLIIFPLMVALHVIGHILAIGALIALVVYFLRLQFKWPRKSGL